MVVFLIGVLILVISALWVTTPFLTAEYISRFGYVGLENQAYLGSLFGSVNALFSGLAFGGVILALFFQQRSLKDQAKEIENLQEIQELTVETLKTTLHANSFSKVYDILDHQDVISARNVINKLGDKPYDEWDNSDEKCIKTLLRAYNIAGIMVKRGLLPEKYVVEDWAPSLKSTWETLEPWVEEQRKDRGDNNHWQNYEELVLAAMKLRPEPPTD